MTPLVIAALGLLAAYALYISALTARAGAPFLDGGADIPGWAAMFTTAGIMVAGAGLADHLALVSRFGLQASHTALGLVLGAMAGLLVHKRLWIAARIAGLATPGEALGRYYGSVTLRIVMLTLTVLFALPWSAHLLSGTAQLVETATHGAIPRAPAVWLIAFFLFLPAVIGGWRAAVLFFALQSVLIAVFLVAVTAFAEGTLPPGFLTTGIPVADGTLGTLIPGVIQNSAGIGKEVAQGGIFTAVGILSTALVFVGLALSPASSTSPRPPPPAGPRGSAPSGSPRASAAWRSSSSSPSSLPARRSAPTSPPSHRSPPWASRFSSSRRGNWRWPSTPRPVRFS